jgi:hypothetical protein
VRQAASAGNLGRIIARSRLESLAQGSCLRHDPVHEARQARFERRRQPEAELHRLRNEAQKHEPARKAVPQARALEQVRDPNLVRREAGPDRGSHRIPLQAHQGARGFLEKNRVHQDRLPRILQMGEEGEAEGSAVQHRCPPGRPVTPEEGMDSEGPEAIVPAQEIAKAEDEERRLAIP